MYSYSITSQLPTTFTGRSQAHVTLEHLSRSLAALNSTVDQLVAVAPHGSATAALYDRLQFNARRAETAMRELRELGFTKSPAATELSQSLTVVVLVVDMVANGHLTASDALAGDALFRRNAARAEASLNELMKNSAV